MSSQLVAYGGEQIVPLERTGASRCATRKTRWEKRSKTSLIAIGGQVVETANTSPWGPINNKPFLPPPFIDLPTELTLKETTQFLKEQRLIELNNKLLFGDLELGDPDIRPPSPSPVYDNDGNRVNKREMVVRNSMLAEQQRLTEHMLTTIPGFEAPPEFKSTKKVRRILIPQEEYPEYNFMGLIIGPRGCNHKRLENESGAQISIRGQGTQKDGKKCDHQSAEEAAMPQHVHIAADTEEKVERAVALIEPLLDPSHPIHEEYKKKGLQQLAQVTGSRLPGGELALNRESAICTICGQMGHFSYECLETQFETYEMANVQCLLCGDRGHITSDCYIAKERNLSPQDIAQLRVQQQVPGQYSHLNASYYQQQSNYAGSTSNYAYSAGAFNAADYSAGFTATYSNSAYSYGTSQYAYNQTYDYTQYQPSENVQPSEPPIPLAPNTVPPMPPPSQWN